VATTGLDFVIFLAMEGGATKRAIVDALEAMGRPFINASLGVKNPGGGDVLQAIVEINGSTVDNRESFRGKVDFGEIDPDDPYTENIQVADLNSLNAALAVLWWKKWADGWLWYYNHRRPLSPRPPTPGQQNLPARVLHLVHGFPG
jgi:hypothetical protein